LTSILAPPLTPQSKTPNEKVKWGVADHGGRAQDRDGVAPWMLLASLAIVLLQLQRRGKAIADHREHEDDGPADPPRPRTSAVADHRELIFKLSKDVIFRAARLGELLEDGDELVLALAVAGAERRAKYDVLGQVEDELAQVHGLAALDVTARTRRALPPTSPRAAG
jgi:hypothetical protein